MKKLQMTYPRISILLFIILIIFLMSLQSLDLTAGLFNQGATNTFQRMWEGLVNIDLSKSTLEIAAKATLETLVYALVALSLTIIFSLLLGVLGSGILLKQKWVTHLAIRLMRFTRSIHELVWAWFFIYALGNNPIAGVLALSIPYSGGLGKQYCDSLKSINQDQVKALRTTGANNFQLLFYGYLPTAFADMLSFTIFRFEMAIRSTTVLSFVGLGGLGFYIQLAIQDLDYNLLWTYLIILVIVVSIVNRWGNYLKGQVIQGVK